MYNVFKPLSIAIALVILTAPIAEVGAKDVERENQIIGKGSPVLWRSPDDITSRNLFYGPGGTAHAPQEPFQFEKEVMQGSSPKFDIVARDGVRWRVKMGGEARAEVAASRLVWAVGYFANENYFVPVLTVQNLRQLNRGNALVKNGVAHGVRLKRYPENEKKIGAWSWARNPFAGTREWYGLRVLMALLNNWDVKDANNSVYQVRDPHPEQRYVVSDLGGSFGPTSLNLSKKGDVASYVNSEWLGEITASSIDFKVPSMPSGGWFLAFPVMASRSGLRWIGKDIPVAEARWMGQLLAQLSPKQIRDAFRGAGYSPEEVEQLSHVVEGRIGQLAKL